MREVNDAADMQKLQEDIDALSAWCRKWGMILNPAKCNYLHYTPPRLRDHFDPAYRIGGHLINRETETKDLGIIISEDLKFGKHIDLVKKKTNSEIGRFKRSFKCRKHAFLSDAYTTYIRPRMEYVVPLWNPSYHTQIEKLEKVQNRFTRLIPNSSNMSHEQRNQCLRISDHQTRRNRGDMVLTWKILNTPDHPCKDILELDSVNRTRSHELKLKKYLATNDIRKHSFPHRVVNQWNSLQSDIVTAPSKNSFKSRFDVLAN